MVVAKTDQAHRALAEQFADHGRTGELERGYLALVWGAPSRPHGTIDAPIGRHPASRTKMAVLPGKGREAVTHWRVVETFGRGKEPVASLIECTLETGRTHQVRVHLAHIGHPADRRSALRPGLQVEAAQASRAVARQACGARPPGAARRAARLRPPGDRHITQI